MELHTSSGGFFFPSSEGKDKTPGPEKDPREQDVILTDLAQRLGVPFLHPPKEERKPGTQTHLEKELKTLSLRERRELEHWVNDLRAKQDLMGLKLSPNIAQASVAQPGAPEGSPGYHANIEWYRKGLNDLLDVRRKVLSAILKGMREQRKLEREQRAAEAKAQDPTKPKPLPSDAAFTRIEGKNVVQMQDELEAMEKHIFAEPPDPTLRGGAGKRNPLYVGGNPYLPHFLTIKQWKDTLARIESGIQPVDPKATPEEQDLQRKSGEATRERIVRARNALAVIENMDPFGAAKAEVLKYAGTPLFRNPAVRGALFAIATLLALLSAVPVLKKLWKGEELQTSDALALAYTLGALHLGGFLPKGKEKASAIAMEVGGRLHADFEQPFRDAVRRMGGKEPAVAAVKELGDLLTTGNATTKRGKQNLLLALAKQETVSLANVETLIAGSDTTASVFETLKEREALRAALLGPPGSPALQKEMENIDKRVAGILRGALANSTQAEKLRKALGKEPFTFAELREVLGGKTSPLLLALSKDTVTGRDRKNFLRTLVSLPLTEKGRPEAAVAAILLLPEPKDTAPTQPASSGTPAGTPQSNPPPQS